MSQQTDEYYSVLGLEPGADAKTVKRAYFKLVKQFTPEEAPEQFQKIRAAYEYLSAPHPDEEEEEKFLLRIPGGEMAETFFKQGLRYLHEYDGKEAINVADSLISIYGEGYEGFYYLLAHATRMTGNTGRSVKAFEKLVELCPEKRIYRRDLAQAYYARNYMNKALAAFREAYQMGERDIDFLVTYADVCDDRNMTEECLRILDEVIPLAAEHLSDNITYLAHALDLLGNITIGTPLFTDSYKERIVWFFREGGLYMDDDDNFLDYLILMDDLLSKHLEENVDDMDYLRTCLDLLQSYATEPIYEQKIGSMQKIISFKIIGKDPRISPDMLELLSSPDMMDDPSIQAFYELDVKLCLLEQWPDLMDQFDVVESDYPEAFSVVRDFATQLRELEDIEPLRDKMIKEYDRKAKWFDMTTFYDRFPERRPWAGTLVWNSEEDGVRRVGPKIGRNDPCPCGSGKKYKKCCGRNA